MKNLFELPELFTLSGLALTPEHSLEAIILVAGDNSCTGGSGSGNTCDSGSGGVQK